MVSRWVLAVAVVAGCTLVRAPAAAAQGQGSGLRPGRDSGSSAEVDPGGWIGRARAAMAARDFDAAVDAADSAAALGSDRSAVQLVVGQAYLSHARDHPSLGAIGKVKKGRAAVERAIELDPGNLDARTTLLQFLVQAPGLVGGSREGARAQAREIERRDRRRGLLARLDVAVADGKADELGAVVDDAQPLFGLAAGDRALMAAFLEAVRRVKDKRLRNELTARLSAERTGAGRRRLDGRR
ncbi:MAG: hypothetical protein ABJC36_04620 [Gemmatimonadales bacterium]